MPDIHTTFFSKISVSVFSLRLGRRPSRNIQLFSQKHKFYLQKHTTIFSKNTTFPPRNPKLGGSESATFWRLSIARYCLLDVPMSVVKSSACVQALLPAATTPQGAHFTLFGGESCTFRTCLACSALVLDSAGWVAERRGPVS